jgi:hypothetical protein
MFSNELAEKLIKLPKTIVGGGITNINLSEEKSRFKLINLEEPEYEFLFEITSNRKITFKITFHNQENNTKEGLIRIDYKGGHKNPESLNDYVPEFVKPYVGHYFQNESHVHIYVEGFKDLAWVVPLSSYHFPILNIENMEDFGEALKAFAKEINIVSSLNIQTAII